MRWMTTLLVAIAALGLAAVAGAEQTYTDPAGDNGAAPDLTQVVVSNDTTQVSFQIVAPSRLPESEAHLLRIDTDGNSATGDAGFEVEAFMMFPRVNVEAWNGSAWVDAASNGLSGRFELNFAGTTLWRLTMPRTLLGSGTSFNFDVISAKLNGDDVEAIDSAPDRGTWRYELALKQCSNGRDDDGDGKVDSSDLGCSGTEDDLESDDPYNLAIARPTVTPASGRAGKPIVIKARVTQVETGLPITTGTASCATKVGGATKRSVGQLTSGMATCRLAAPKVARPATIRGTITVKSKSTSISAPYAFRVS